MSRVLLSVVVYSLFVFLFRWGAWEMHSDGEKIEWFALTAFRLLIVGIIDTILMKKWPVSKSCFWLRLSVLVAGFASTYAQNILGPDAKVSMEPSGAVLVTGSTTGIGYATATELVRLGWTVIVPARDPKKAILLAEEINNKVNTSTKNSGGKAIAISGHGLELTSQASVRKYAASVDSLLKEMSIPLSRLILNAGLMRPETYLTEDGAELTIAANHLGHHTLTLHLLPQLQAASAIGIDTRVVVLTSSMHRQSAQDLFSPRNSNNLSSNHWTVLANFSIPPQFDYFTAYSHSKLANVLWAQELARSLNSSNIAVLTVHPGLVFSDMPRSLPTAMQVGQLVTFPLLALLMKPATVGARSTLHAALSPDFRAPLRTVPIIENCRSLPTHTHYFDDGAVLAASKLLWSASVDYAARAESLATPSNEPVR